MSTEILVNAGLTETRIALLRDGRVAELIYDRALESDAAARHDTLVGNIYLGRVQRVTPGVNAAFVDIGLPRAGFLAAREAQVSGDRQGQPRGIAESVRDGQILMVQVLKDPIGGKGSRLTLDIALPGRLLVLTPAQTNASLSRRIEDAAERARLLDLAEEIAGRLGMGVIVRTAAFGASAAELSADAEALREVWSGIEARAREAQPPACLFVDLDPISRALRDHADATTGRIVLDGQTAYAQARHYAQAHAPFLLDRIALFSGDLFEAEGVEGEIERALASRVGLPSGGWIMIQTTEALTAVDVNSGRFAQGGGIAETSLRTNLEAAEETARQLRLRGIGGIVVIDFIHMDAPDPVAEVLEVLRRGFAGDRARNEIAPLSPFGLVALTRKRVRESLPQRLTAPCPTCDGRGRVSTPAARSGALLRRIEREACMKPGHAVHATADPSVVAWIEAQPDVLDRLAHRIGAPLDLRSGDATDPEAFQVWTATRQEESIP